MEVTKVEERQPRIASAISSRMRATMTFVNADRGFGFARLPQGLGTVFVHVKQCVNCVLPKENDAVLLTLAFGREEGKYEGHNVEVA